MSELVITIDSSSDDDLETEETIRVLWSQTMKMHHSSICVTHPLEKIYKEISELYNTPLNLVQISYNDEIVSPSDSLESLGFHVVKDSLYASTAMQAPVVTSVSDPGKNKVHVKCLAKDRKKPLDYYLNPRENLQTLFETLAKDMDVHMKSLKVRFDGDTVHSKDTPQSLDLDGGECFHVFISK